MCHLVVLHVLPVLLLSFGPPSGTSLVPFFPSSLHIPALLLCNSEYYPTSMTREVQTSLDRAYNIMKGLGCPSKDRPQARHSGSRPDDPRRSHRRQALLTAYDGNEG